MASAESNDDERASLNSLIEKEHAQIKELRHLVQQEQRKVEKVRATQQLVEDNICRLYDTAKIKVDERDQALARLRETHGQRAGTH